MRKIICIVLVFVLMLSLSACIGAQSTKTEISLYFKDSKSNELVVEKVKYTSSQNTVDMANYAMSKLMEGPVKTSNVHTIPENTRFLSLIVKDQTATVNFSKEFTEFTGANELMARFSVVRTLCDIPGISGVLITVEGLPLISSATGKEVGLLSQKDIVTDIDANVSPVTTQTTVLNLYFATADGMALKTEERKVETQNTISIEKAIMTELLKGPSSPELSSVIPSGTKLLNLETKDGVCYVNLSQDFITKFSGGTGMLTVYSIVNTLCSLENVQKVQILIEGEKGLEFGNYAFYEPIEPNLSIVQK